MGRALLAVVLLSASWAAVGPLGVRAAGAQNEPAGAFVIGYSVQGRPIVAHRRSGDAPSRHVAVIGVIHGDETAGRKVTDALLRADLPANVELTVISSINPDGEASGRRGNSNGVDLNRNFPTGWISEGLSEYTAGDYDPGPEPLSEPEARAALDWLAAERPDLTVWYHQPWGVVSCNAPAPSPVPVEGAGAVPALSSTVPVPIAPGDALCHDFADRVGLPVEVAPRPGSATGWAVANDLPALVVELPERGIDPIDIDRHVDAVLTAFAGVEPGERYLRPAVDAGIDLGLSVGGAPTEIETENRLVMRADSMLELTYRNVSNAVLDAHLVLSGIAESCAAAQRASLAPRSSRTLRCAVPADAVANPTALQWRATVTNPADGSTVTTHDGGVTLLPEPRLAPATLTRHLRPPSTLRPLDPPRRVFDSRAGTKLAVDTPRWISLSAVLADPAAGPPTAAPVEGSVAVPTAASVTVGAVDADGAGLLYTGSPSRDPDGAVPLAGFEAGATSTSQHGPVALVLGAGGDWGFWLTAKDASTNVTVDVDGVWTTARDGLRYQPTIPTALVLDDEPDPAGGATDRRLVFDGLAADTEAVELQVTARGADGWNTVWSGDQPWPATSSLNVNNAMAVGSVTVAVGSAKDVWLRSSAGQAVSVELLGEYRRSQGLLFRPTVAPARVFDSRLRTGERHAAAARQDERLTVDLRRGPNAMAGAALAVTTTNGVGQVLTWDGSGVAAASPAATAGANTARSQRAVVVRKATAMAAVTTSGSDVVIDFYGAFVPDDPSAPSPAGVCGASSGFFGLPAAESTGDIVACRLGGRLARRYQP